MRKLISLFLLMMMSGFRIFGQDIRISFQPRVSEITIDSVWITNQTKVKKIKIEGNETLILSPTTGIISPNSLQKEGIVYPNPCSGNATLSFVQLLHQKTEIRIYNGFGQLLLLKMLELNAGRHKFNITFPSSGIYGISVLNECKSSKYKVISFADQISECKIEYYGSESINALKEATIDKTLNFTTGDNLLFSVFSGKDNTIITDSPIETKIYSVEFFECKDPDNKHYKAVKIGNQIWMAENLAYLPYLRPNNQGSIIIPYYYVNGYSGIDLAEAKQNPNYSIYGVLYNWEAVMAGSTSSDKNPSGVKGICPQGWHLPSDREWKELEIYLGMDQSQANAELWRGNDQGTKMKSTSGWLGNENGTNSVGFTGLPGGIRNSSGGFPGTGFYGEWWSSTEVGSNTARYRALTGGGKIYRSNSGKEYGNSVRCVKD